MHLHLFSTQEREALCKIKRSGHAIRSERVMAPLENRGLVERRKYKWAAHRPERYHKIIDAFYLTKHGKKLCKNLPMKTLDPAVLVPTGAANEFYAVSRQEIIGVIKRTAPSVWRVYNLHDDMISESKFHRKEIARYWLEVKRDFGEIDALLEQSPEKAKAADEAATKAMYDLIKDAQAGRFALT